MHQIPSELYVLHTLSPHSCWNSSVIEVQPAVDSQQIKLVLLHMMHNVHSMNMCIVYHKFGSSYNRGAIHNTRYKPAGTLDLSKAPKALCLVSLLISN